MKTVLLMSLLLLSVGAFGQCCQSTTIAPAVAPPQMGTTWSPPDHSMHASRHGLAFEQDLKEPGGVTMAQGERPVWEVYNVEQISLGDAARDYRKQHLTARKAQIVWEQVGN